MYGAFMTTSADLSDATFRSDGLFIRILVDSGASDHFIDPCLTPGRKNIWANFEVLAVPHMIVAAGQHILKGVATSTVHGIVTDDDGRHISFRAVLWYQD